MSPVVASSDLYRNWIWDSGAYALSFNTMWGALSISARVGQDMGAEPIDWDQLFRVLPLREIPALMGRNVPWYSTWLDHPLYDDFWKEQSVHRQYEQIKAPAFNVGGWYDVFLNGTLENYAGMRERGGSQEAREGGRLVIGPWFHGSTGDSKSGQINFGAAAAYDEQGPGLAWFDYWLKGKQSDLLNAPPVHLFVMGENEWRDFENWPPEGTTPVSYYLHARKGANSLLGDGTLSTKEPGKEVTDMFTYDPSNPVPTLGGNDCCRETIVTEGPYDQRPVERRDDVLVYSSSELSEPVTVIGPVEVKLWAASSAVNTDFTAKLVDVYPDGRAINITSGILRAPHRDGLDTWNELEPNKPYEFTIELRPTANTFLAGHMIRLEISSSNFPRYDRNLNTTGAEIADKTEMVVANQQVFHTKTMASRIILPVMK
jgi:putative CocE/NonD family hydrolase